MDVLEKLNCKEKKAFEELRARMKNALLPEMYEDSILFYRFLKARDFDIEKAETMLRKHIVWRKAFQLDTYLENFKVKEVYNKYIGSRFIGYDKDGDFIRYMPAGKIYSDDLLKCMTMNDYEKHLIYDAEESLSMLGMENKKTGRTCFQASAIYDLDQLTFTNATSKATAEIYLRMSQLLQDTYPEHLKVAYAINAPAAFVFLFAILKTVMSAALIRKIRVFGHDNWKEALLEAIDADVLPAFLGGKRTDPDGNPLCLTFISHDCKIPSKYYLTNEERWFRDMSRVKKILVPPKEKRKISVEVKGHLSLIQWKFESKNKDIGFGLFLEKDEEEFEILPIIRFTTSDGAETGSYKAQTSGKYLIVFDNSYSQLTSKEIRYCVTVSNIEA